jgi:pimeloyl-ACP methyl ester carboxylesterase
MATFVLVHGAWGGGWVYKGVARRLRSEGHDVYVPTLTGLGERSHLASPAIDLATHIQDVVNVIRYEQLNDIILCGHSYGGMVITGTAAAVGERIRTLFYLDAFLPEDGQSLWDIAGADGQRHYIEAQRGQPGMVLPMGNRRIDGEPPHMNRHPLLTLTQPVQMTGAEKHIRNRTYVYATRETPTAFTRFYDRVRIDPTWKTCTIDTGHMVMSDDPAGLEKLLLEEVDR